MKTWIKVASTSLFLALGACQSVTVPSVPGGIFDGSDVPACPDLQTGPAPFVPPFPSTCASMNEIGGGVRYIPITNGDTAAGSPRYDATIVVHYEAFLADSGVKIDSSYARGESSVFEMGDLIDGWAAAAQLMNPGDEWLVYVPADRAFGDEPLGDLVPANADLVYRVRLEGFLSALALAEAIDAAQAAESEVSEPTGPDMAAWRTYLPWDGARNEITTLPSGVSIVTLESGVGTYSPSDGDQVLIHYEGRLAATSDFFDSSWSRSEPTLFEVGTLIAGFNEALKLMREGDRILVHIPSELAYGEQGAGADIPPNADLMFQIVLLEIR